MKKPRSESGAFFLCMCLNRLDFFAIKKAGIAPLQLPTLAAFLPWGSSEGAGRADRAQS